MNFMYCPMVNVKDYEDAKLFAYFIRNVRERPDRMGTKTLSHIISNSFCSSEDKYKCMYCGCEYVYRRSLISHLRKLHNIREIE